MSEFDKMLEDVAQELAEMGASNRSWQAKDNCEVLKRRLLPLLEAGERTGHLGCEDGWYACPKSEDYISGNRTDTECNCGYDNYQAAKQAAMEGRCSTDQK